MDWVSPIATQLKKIGEIKIFGDYRALNDACVNDPFPKPFTDEILESVVGNKVYSFTNGFIGYH